MQGRLTPEIYLPRHTGHPVLPETPLVLCAFGVTLGAFCHPPCAHPPPALTRQAGAGSCLQDEGMDEGVGPEPPSLPGRSSALVPQLPQL